MKKYMLVCGVVLAIISVTGAGGGIISGFPPVFGSVDPLGDHSTRVTVTPQSASSSDDISVTISRWAPEGYQVASSTVRVQGSTIRLDLHWIQIGLVIAVYPPAPPSYCRIEHTQSIGKWGPGTYTLIVSNDSMGIASARFTVIGDPSESPSTGWSLIDQLLGNVDDPSSSGQSIIDQVRGTLHDSRIGDGLLHGYEASLQ